MNLIKAGFSWLKGTNSTGVNANTDQLNDSYRTILGGLNTPANYTTEGVKDAVGRAAWTDGQLKLAKIYHDAHQRTIKNLGELDKITTSTAVLYSDTASQISDRRVEAQEKILINEASNQINDTRINALKQAYAQGLKI